MSSNNFFYPLANAYKTYGQYEPPGPGVRPLDAPMANHLDMSFTEADEVDYPVEAAYRMSVPMYESHLGPYPLPPNPSPPPVQPVGVNSVPRSVRENYNNVQPSPLQPVRVNSPPHSVKNNNSNVLQAPALSNNVLDYNKLQGTKNPTDLSIQILRDTNYRYVTLQNSSYRPVGIGITTYYTGTIPSIRFVAAPGVTRYLGINSQGEAAQYIWPLDPDTGRQVGSPSILSAMSNDFVLRDGINGWNVQNFTRPSYRAAF